MPVSSQTFVKRFLVDDTITIISSDSDNDDIPMSLSPSTSNSNTYFPHNQAAFNDKIASDDSLPDLESPLPKFLNVHVPAASTSTFTAADADFECPVLPVTPKDLYLKAPQRLAAWQQKNVFCNPYQKRIAPLKRIAPDNNGEHEFIGKFIVAFDGFQVSFGRIDSVHVCRDDITYGILFLKK